MGRGLGGTPAQASGARLPHLVSLMVVLLLEQGAQATLLTRHHRICRVPRDLRWGMTGLAGRPCHSG